MDSRNIEIYLPGSTVRSSAYICLAVILAVFMLTFAAAPKVRTQDSNHYFVSANYYSTWKQPGTDASGCSVKEPKGEPVTDDRFPTTSDMRAGSWPVAERAHLCFNYDGVLCLAPPTIGT
jgi:hypothetical protein